MVKTEDEKGGKKIIRWAKQKTQRNMVDLG